MFPLEIAKMTSSLIGTVPPVPMIHSSTPW